MNWTLTHGFFLRMGGFCLETPSGRRLQLDIESLESAIKGSASKGSTSKGSASEGSAHWLEKLKKVDEGHINDHAKSNSLTKFIACGQALWLVTQVISRICQHRAVTLLEISTTAYAACALTAYASWWKKPQSPTLPITFPCPEELLPPIKVEDTMYYKESSIYEHVWAGQHWSSLGEKSGEIVNFGLVSLCSVLFGAIHVASWNISLLTIVEQWLWRGSALYCCAAGMILGLMLILSGVCEQHSLIRESMEETIDGVAVRLIPSLYLIARLFMIVEAFLSLRALPHSAYEEVQWSSFVPHI